jgi:hypothetical protein
VVKKMKRQNNLKKTQPRYEAIIFLMFFVECRIYSAKERERENSCLKHTKIIMYSRENHLIIASAQLQPENSTQYTKEIIAGAAEFLSLLLTVFGVV